MSIRIPPALGLAALSAAAAAWIVGAVTAATAPTTSAATSQVAVRAVAVRIVFPTGRVVASPALTSPGRGGAPSFSYPQDGSVVVSGATTAATTATTVGAALHAESSSSVKDVSIFDGEITAGRATATATATAARSAGGGFTGTGVENLEALGRAHAYGRAALGDWGYLTIGEHSIDRSSAPDVKRFAGTVSGFTVHLTTHHGGLPAGTMIEVGYAVADVQTAPPAPVAVTGADPTAGDRPQLLPPTTGPLIGVPQIIEPPLGVGSYVFPVFGRARLSDGYGTSVGGAPYERGVQIFGSLGQPIVAVTDGTLYSVGWNRSDGDQIRLRDRYGNQFFYAHLSAFSTVAQPNARVAAGQVIGFMGDTGTTDGLPTHLSFEVHPLSMLFLGAGGAVDPAPYLSEWHRLRSLAFPVATGWSPAVTGTASAPPPGAFLLGGSDISQADGLAPGSLLRLVPGSAHG